MNSAGRVLVALATVVVALTGCTVVAPEPSRTPTPTPTPTVESVVGVEVSASGVAALGESGDQLSTVAFSNGVPDLLALFTDLFGSPEVYVSTPEDCSSGTFYRWGPPTEPLTLHDNPDSGAPSFQPVSVSVKLRELAGIAVTSATGFQVGDDAAPLVEGLPEEQFDANLGWFMWEVGEVVDNRLVGGYAFIEYETQTVANFSAPGSHGAGFC
jgi:hypothetical protein